MTTTPNEPVEDPEVVPSGDPSPTSELEPLDSLAPVEDLKVDPETQSGL